MEKSAPNEMQFTLVQCRAGGASGGGGTMRLHSGMRLCVCLSDACPFSESAFVPPGEVFTHSSFHFTGLHWDEVVNITRQEEE